MSYSRKDLINFLEAVDREMTSKADLVVIGGASLTLAYNFSNTTIDVDLLNKISGDLLEAIEKAKTSTSLDIRVTTSKVYSSIMRMEERFLSLADLRHLRKLSIFVPEKHDLALMKCARSEARDLDYIRGLHSSETLDSEILYQRFVTEVLPLNAGDNDLAKAKFLAMIEILFDDRLADSFEVRF